MAIIVFDDFNRPDNPTSLGTATTGQVWVPYDETWTPGDTHWGILSNQGAREAGGNPSVGGGGYALVETGLKNCVIKVTINNASFGGDLNNSNFGLVFRWTDSLNYWIAVWSRAGRFLRICQIAGGVTSCTNEGFPGPDQIQDGDTLTVACCNDTVKGYHNDVLTVTYTTNPGASGTGTRHGLQCGVGIIQDTAFSLYDDFTVETNLTCEGSVWTIPALTWAAEGSVSSDTPTGGARTMRFDSGSGSDYYLVAPLVDSRDELRSKLIKAARVTSRRTNSSFQIHTYDVNDGIDIEDLENGTNSVTGDVALTDSANVAQSERVQLNCPNAVVHTIRVAGDDSGQDMRDEIHEIAIEVADQGVRR